VNEVLVMLLMAMAVLVSCCYASFSNAIMAKMTCGTCHDWLENVDTNESRRWLGMCDGSEPLRDAAQPAEKKLDTSAPNGSIAKFIRYF
jgi:hypothetical protein